MEPAMLIRTIELVDTLMCWEQKPYDTIFMASTYDRMRASIVTGPLQIIKRRDSTSWSQVHGSGIHLA